MRSPIRLARGFTLLELIIVLAVIAFLVSLAIPTVSSTPVHGRLIMYMNNERQIHLAAMSMVMDGVTNKDPSLGWPGDLKAKGHIANLSDYVNLLVRNDYLKAGDLKIFAGPEFNSYKGTLSSGSNGVLAPAFAEENCAFKMYLVRDDDPSNTLFLATKNYTYNKPLNDPKAKPYGDKGFVVIRKGGDGSIYKKQQAQTLSMIGQLPGGGTVESAENCLNPSPAAP